MKWPVSKDKEGESGLLFIDLHSILNFTPQGNRVLVHTKDAVYYQLDSLDRLESALALAEFPFVRADRGNLVNVEQIMEVDEERAYIFFEGSSSGERGKEATISRPKLPNVINRIRNRIKNEG